VNFYFPAEKADSVSDAEPDSEGPIEIALMGDLTDNVADIADKLLGVPQGGPCILYFDSPGGSPYAAVSLMNLVILRELQATAIVTGECSSAALWPFAACQRRFVTPFSALLFHPMRWQSEENVQLAEAAEWARHFAHLESQMDQLLADLFNIPLEKLVAWMKPGQYVTGKEIAESGLAEILDPISIVAMRRQASDQ